MTLEFKPDWDETKARFRAWWDHEYFGRAAIGVTAPRTDPPASPAPPDATNLEEQWFDIDLISRRQLHGMSQTFFGGEAVPIWHGGYPGHTAIPTYLGCHCELDMHTGWWHPIIGDEGPEVASLALDRSCREYRHALALLRRAASDARGRCLVSVGAFGGCGDTLAALRDTEPLLMDCVERPDWVREADLFLMEMWCEYYEEVYQLVREVDEGSTCWFGLWSPGKTYAVQNDFSYNIGPAMFRELFVPALRLQTEWLDHTVYHVDGINAFRHVEALCELPRLQALQILPGAGKPSPLHYMDTLRDVQAAGKNLHITLPIDEVRPALEQLSARGLFIGTRAETEEQARELLEDAERWSVDRG